MKTALYEALERLRALENDNNSARETWTTLRGEDDDKAAQALLYYRQAQQFYEAAMDTVVDSSGCNGLVPELKGKGELAAALTSLPAEHRQYLATVLQQLRLENLIDGELVTGADLCPDDDGWDAAETFAKRADVWFLSVNVTDAMHEIRELLHRCGAEGFEAALEVNWRFKEKESWSQAVELYREELASAEAADDGENDLDTIAETVACRLYLVFRRRTDLLNDKMRDEIAFRQSFNGTNDALNSLPCEVARMVVSFMDTAMPQQQTQTQPKRQSRRLAIF